LFDRDCLSFDTHRLRTESRLQSLDLHTNNIELDTTFLVLDLLRYVGGGLCTLSMQIDETNPDEGYDPNRQVDLEIGKLAAVCHHL
jgi:hypothetical protein